MIEMMEKVEMAARQFYADHGPNSWLDHIVPVMDRVKQLHRPHYAPKTSLIAAAFHDCAKRVFGAEDHARKSAQIAEPVIRLLAQQSKEDTVTEDDIRIILEAISLHDSNLITFPTICAADLAAADANPPELKFMVEKSIRWGRNHGLSPEQIAENTLTHLKEKYGSGGWFHWPERYRALWGARVDHCIETIDYLTKSDVRRFVDQVI